MRRLLLLLAVTGCNHATYRWRPSLVTQVPDSTPVRFAMARGAPIVSGRALNWQQRQPRVVTARGDTVVVPDSAITEVRLKEKRSFAIPGAIVAGVVASVATCPNTPFNCGSPSRAPLFWAGAGALIGSVIKIDKWVRVR